MTPNETEIFKWLEVLAAHCPWDRVDIWVSREPAGIVRFTAYAAGSAELGLESIFGNGKTPQEAVNQLIRENPDRDPERARRQKIAELEMQIFKLKSMQLSLPPYRPLTLIGVGSAPDLPEPTPPSARTAIIEVQSTREDDIPF